MKLLRTALRVLRPAEQLGLVFLLVMVGLYAYFDLPIFVATGRMVLWFGVTGVVIFTLLLAQLFTERNPRQTFSPHNLGRMARDWIPFVAFLLVYDNLHDITRLINPNEFDAFFIVVDWILFFGNHPTVLLEQLVTPWLTEWLSVAYILYGVSFFTTLGAFYYTKRIDAFHETATAVLITIYVGFIFYLLFPCVGPILAQHDLHTVELQGGGVFGSFQNVTELYGTYRNYFHCFPSLHFGVTAVFWFFTWKHMRWLFYLYAPFVLSLWFSTVYLRWHYVIDLIAGAIIAGYAIWLGPIWYRSWKKRNAAATKKSRQE